MEEPFEIKFTIKSTDSIETQTFNVLVLLLAKLKSDMDDSYERQEILDKMRRVLEILQ